MSNRITRKDIDHYVDLVNAMLRRRRSRLQYLLNSQNPGDGRTYWLTTPDQARNLTHRLTARQMYEVLLSMSNMLERM